MLTLVELNSNKLIEKDKILKLILDFLKKRPNSKLIDIEKMEDFKNIGDVKKKLFYYDGGFKVESIT